MGQKILSGLVSAALIVLSAAAEEPPGDSKMAHTELATVGGGCFWCTEAIFQRIKGVSKVEPGYAGGAKDNPTYEEVSSGRTGHAEVIQLAFDPAVIRYDELLEIFFHLHDPTTLNKQGADVGTQYRSIILYHSEDQKKAAEAVKEKIGRSGLWADPLVTEIAPYTKFYSAEAYHHDYFNKNSSQPYCSFVIAPKIKKLYKEYADKLKPA